MDFSPYRTLLHSLAVALFATIGTAQAQQAPHVLVRSVSEDVLRVAQQDPDLRTANAARAQQLIEEKIAPHFDFSRITRLVVGRSWREATPDQQRRLVEAFRAVLVRTYAAAFRGYREITIDVRPLTLAPNANDVVVRTDLRWPESSGPLSVDYSMFRSPQGWKVYDVAVGGVSMVTTYRATFAEQIRSGGIAGLVQALETPGRAEDPVASRSSRSAAEQ